MRIPKDKWGKDKGVGSQGELAKGTRAPSTRWEVHAYWAVNGNNREDAGRVCEKAGGADAAESLKMIQFLWWAQARSIWPPVEALQEKLESATWLLPDTGRTDLFAGTRRKFIGATGYCVVQRGIGTAQNEVSYWRSQDEVILRDPKGRDIGVTSQGCVTVRG